MTIKQCLTKFNSVILIFLITGSGVFANWEKFTIQIDDVSRIAELRDSSCDNFTPANTGDSDCFGSGATLKYTIQKARLCNGNSSEDSSATCTTIKEGDQTVDIASGSDFSYVSPEKVQAMISSGELSGEFDHLEIWLSNTIQTKPYLKTQNGKTCHIGTDADNEAVPGIDDMGFRATEATSSNMRLGVSQEVSLSINRIGPHDTNPQKNAVVVTYRHPDTGNIQSTSYYLYEADGSIPTQVSAATGTAYYYQNVASIKVALKFPKINITKGVVLDASIKSELESLNYTFEEGECRQIFWDPPFFIGHLNTYDNSGQ